MHLFQINTINNYAMLSDGSQVECQDLGYFYRFLNSFVSELAITTCMPNAK